MQQSREGGSFSGLSRLCCPVSGTPHVRQRVTAEQSESRPFPLVGEHLGDVTYPVDGSYRENYTITGVAIWRRMVYTTHVVFE